jgi:hypothetical protein
MNEALKIRKKGEAALQRIKQQRDIKTKIDLTAKELKINYNKPPPPIRVIETTLYYNYH